MPMRILGRGRDAYILAGYLHKRGRWTPHWSERYFVLTSTHIHYFKKDRNQLFGEERGTIPIDRCVVRARHGKEKEFEIIAFIDDTGPSSTPGQPGLKKKPLSEPKKRKPTSTSSVPSTTSTTSPHSTTSLMDDDDEESSTDKRSKQPRPWILKAKSEEECLLWIKAIHDAQSQVTPAMLAAAQKPLIRPAPRLAQHRSNKTLFNTGALSGTALTSTLAASTSSPSPSPRPSVKAITTANGVALPIAQPINPQKAATTMTHTHTLSSSTIAASANSLSTASMSPMLTSTISSTSPQNNTKTPRDERLYSVDEDPILLVTLENNTSHEIVLGRMMSWGTPLSLGACAPGSILVACMHDGRVVRIPTEAFTSPSGSRDFQVVDDPYGDSYVRMKWTASRGLTRSSPQPEMSSFLRTIGSPLLFLVLCLYLALSTLISQVAHDFPLVDVRKLWLTQTGYIIAFGMCLALQMIHMNLSKFTPPPTHRTITVTFAARTMSDTLSLGAGATYAQAVRSNPVIGNTVIGELGRNLVSETPLRIHRRTADDSSSDDADESVEETKLNRHTSEETTEMNNETTIGSQAGGIRGVDTVGPVDTTSHEIKRAVSRMPNPPVVHEMDDDEENHATDIEMDEDEDDGIDESGVRKPAVHTAEWGGWTDADYTVTQVRGKEYMIDQKKIPADRPIFRSAHLDVFCTQEKLYHMSARPNSYAAQRYKAVLKEREHLRALGLPITPNPEADTLSPLIVINFLVPLGDRNCNLLLYFTRKIHSKRSKGSDFNRIIQGSHPHAHTYKPVPINTNVQSTEEAKDSPRSTNDDENSQSQTRSDSISITGRSPSSISGTRQSSADMDALAAARAASLSQVEEDANFDEQRLAAFDRLLMAFMRGSDEFRSARMKVIPRVADGGWIVKKVVGGRPAILGQKITQYYYKNEEMNYIEIAVDLGSSKMAGKILQVVNGQASKLVVDITFLLQGETEEELPESLIGGFSLIHLKIDKFRPLEQLGI